MTDRAQREIGPDNWLYIGLHALTLYAEEGGQVAIEETAAGLMVKLPGVMVQDERLPQAARAMIRPAEDAPGGER